MIEFDIALFRAQIKAFSDAAVYPDELLSLMWDMATNYISTDDYGVLSGSARQHALNLLAAHLLFLSDAIVAGSTAGVVTSASEGTVSISLDAPESKSALSYWLNQSPYGQQLLALLRSKSTVGFYVGGYPNSKNFRNGKGRFG